MAISLSTSNVLTNKTPSITDAGVDETPSNISDANHSLNYTSGGGSAAFEVSYGVNSSIGYVAVSGHNAADGGEATINLYDASTLIDTVTIKRNHNVMFTFPEMEFTNLRIVFVTALPTSKVTVSFIAAGKCLSIKTGEQAGYKRAWLNRHTIQKTSTNLVVGPASGIKKRVALKGTLSFPDEYALFTENEWQDFIDFSFEQPFFIKEVPYKPESTYINFDPKHDIKAHSQTRKLNSISMSFTTFNGL